MIKTQVVSNHSENDFHLKDPKFNGNSDNASSRRTRSARSRDAMLQQEQYHADAVQNLIRTKLKDNQTNIGDVSNLFDSGNLMRNHRKMSVISPVFGDDQEQITFDTKVPPIAHFSPTFKRTDLSKSFSSISNKHSRQTQTIK